MKSGVQLLKINKGRDCLYLMSEEKSGEIPPTHTKKDVKKIC